MQVHLNHASCTCLMFMCNCQKCVYIEQFEYIYGMRCIRLNIRYPGLPDYVICVKHLVAKNGPFLLVQEKNVVLCNCLTSCLHIPNGNNLLWPKAIAPLPVRLNFRLLRICQCFTLKVYKTKCESQSINVVL